MIILEDSRQQEHKHDTKLKYFAEHDVEVRRTKLYIGDYTLPTNQSICVDTKFCIAELISDICGKQHERFRNELLRAQESGIKLIVLVENESDYIPYTNKKIRNEQVNSLKDLFSWKNPRLFIRKGGKQVNPGATKGATIAKACITMENKYNVKFEFCHPKDSGKRIIELLSNDKK